MHPVERRPKDRGTVAAFAEIGEPIAIEYSKLRSVSRPKLASSAARPIRAACSGSAPPWAIAERTASSGSSAARAGSSMAGMRSGPSTSGCIRWPGPTSMGAADQRAIAADVAMTSRHAGQPKRDRSVAAYTGQLRRLRSSRPSCTSTMIPRTGPCRSRSTTRSAVYSVGVTWVRFADSTRALSYSGSCSDKALRSSSAASSGVELEHEHPIVMNVD